ncbi:MAG: hypothetical protein K940chlam3_00466 [Chlamydiae bacterium]|nr:hypothetical protein [Chlamydiota bacterium]
MNISDIRSIIEKNTKPLCENCKNEELVGKFEEVRKKTLGALDSLESKDISLKSLDINLLEEDGILFLLGEEVALLASMIKPEEKDSYKKFLKTEKKLANQLASKISEEEEDQEILDHLEKYPELYLGVFKRICSSYAYYSYSCDLFPRFITSNPHLNRQIVEVFFENKGRWSGYPILMNLKEFRFEQDFNQELILKLAKSDSSSRHWLISNFEILPFDQEFKKKLGFSLSIGITAKDVIDKMDAFGIVSEEDKQEMVNRMMRDPHGARAVIQNLEKIGIEDRDFLQDLAWKFCESRSRKYLPANLEKFQITDREVLKGILENVLNDKVNSFVLTNNFEVVAVHGEEFKKKVVTTVLEHKYVKAILRNYDQFEIDDNEFNFCIASEVLKQVDPETFCSQILKFGIQGDAYKKKLISDLIKKENGTNGIFNHFDHFAMEDLEYKKHLVKQALNENKTHIVAKNINKFAIHEKEFHKQVVLELMESEEGVREVIRCIKNFDFDEEFKIGLIPQFTENPMTFETFCLCLKNFDFNPEYLEKLAFELLERPLGQGFISVHLEEFKIKSPETIRKLADEILKYEFGAELLGDKISKFKAIQDKDFWIKIAQQISQSDFGAKILANNFYNFKIENPETRKGLIRKMAAYETSVHTLVVNINKFDEGDPEFRKELVEIMIQTDKGALEIAKYISSFAKKDDVEFRKKVISRLVEFEVGTELLFFIVNIFVDKDFMKANLFKALRFNNKTMLKKLSKSCEKFGIPADTFEKHTQECPSKMIRWFGEDLLNEIKDIEHLETRIKLTQWVTYWTMLGDLNDMIPEARMDNFFNKKFINSLYRIRNHELRIKLVEHLTKILIHSSDEEYHQFLNDIEKSTISTCPLEIVLCSLALDGVNLEPEVEQRLRKLNRFLKDGPNQVLFLQTLQNLSQTSELIAEQFADVMKYLSHFKGKTLQSELRCLLGLEKFNQLGILVDPPESPKKPIWIRNHLLNIFHGYLEDLDLSYKEQIAFVKFFIQSRMPEALPVYLANLQSLPEQTRIQLMKTISDYLKEVTSGNFHDQRYEGSEHLNTIFDSQIGLKKLWKNGMKSIPLVDYVEKPEEKAEVNFKELIPMKIGDGHLPKDKFPKLMALLQDEEFEGEQDKEYQVVDNILCGLYNGEYPENKILGTLTTLKKKLSNINSDSPFLNDINAFKQALQPKKSPITNWKIINTDDPIDLLLCGTEVAGSCQNISEKPLLNRALMGYVMDGKHRMLAIKDQNNRIVGRLILRLLWDEKNEKPVIFFERIYPNTLQKTYTEALKDVAINWANELGLDLVSKETKSEVPYKGFPVSLGSRENVMFEYCDAAQGIQTGPFKIRGCDKLN